MKTQSSIEISLKSEKRDFEKVNIKSSSDAVKYARNFYKDDIDLYESAFVIFMSNSNNVIAFYKASQGGITSSVIDNRLIGKCALDCLCTRIILVHNHPSGNTKFSDSDIVSTKRLKSTMELFDIKVLDSIVLTSESYSSMIDEGLI